MPDDLEIPVVVEEPEPTFGGWLKAITKSIGRAFIRYPLASAATVALVIGAVFLALFGKNVQIGGLLEKLWGKTPKKPDVRVIPPPKRVDDTGKPIIPGESDDKGWVQAPVVVPIKPPSILSNPDTIVVNHPEKGEVTIPLPVGVKNSDVKQIIEVQPNAYQVVNHDKPSVDTKKLLKEI